MSQTLWLSLTQACLLASSFTIHIELGMTRDYMLIYGSYELCLLGYRDSDFMSNKDFIKSTYSYVFTLGGRAIG